MSLNQYAVYQLKPDAEIRPYRFKTYQQLMDSHMAVNADHYHQVYLTTMVKETALEEIRRRLETKLPPQFLGNALNVSDVIAITKELADALRKNQTIDWQKRESARSKMRMIIKRLLKKHKYPPEGMEDAVKTVMIQCELWTDNVMEA